jgi:hypothetical protein
MATGAWQAAPRRLGWTVALGIAAAAAVAGLAPHWWPAAMPGVSAAAFGIYGLAAQQSHELDARHYAAPWRRRCLRWTRRAAAVTAGAAAIAFVLGGVAVLTLPVWMR